MTLKPYPEIQDRARLLEVARLGVDVEVPREYLTELVEQVAAEMDTPFAMVTGLLSDAQVFLAGRGPVPAWVAEVGGTPIEWAFCSPLLREQEARYVNDFTADAEFQDNPLVTLEGIRSYIGAPVISSRGLILGSLCGLDTRPREFDAEQLTAVQDLADETARRIETHAFPPGDV